MTARTAFVATIVLALILTYPEARTEMILLVGYAIIHALARYGHEATTKYYDERRRRILAGQRPTATSPRRERDEAPAPLGCAGASSCPG